MRAVEVVSNISINGLFLFAELSHTFIKSDNKSKLVICCAFPQYKYYLSSDPVCLLQAQNRGKKGRARNPLSSSMPTSNHQQYGSSPFAQHRSHRECVYDSSNTSEMQVVPYYPDVYYPAMHQGMVPGQQIQYIMVNSGAYMWQQPHGFSDSLIYQTANPAYLPSQQTSMHPMVLPGIRMHSHSRQSSSYHKTAGGSPI